MYATNSIQIREVWFCVHRTAMHLLSGQAATVNHDYFFFSESVLIKKSASCFHGN